MSQCSEGQAALLHSEILSLECMPFCMNLEEEKELESHTLQGHA